MKEIFVIGDIHGCITRFNELLKNWNPVHQKLVILGDLIDRGEDSLAVILKCMKLQEEHGAIIIGGNHDQMLLDWLEDPNYRLTWYFRNGGGATLHSFFDGQDLITKHTPEKIASLIKEQFPEELNFLRNLPNYYEEGNYVFVHAGINLARENWKECTSEEFRWIREKFHYEKNNTGKIFVFGHTPTSGLNSDKSCNPWISPCRTKIGLDGGAVFGGLLLGMVIKEDSYEVYAA